MIDLPGESPVRQECRAKEVERVGSLRLRGKHVVQEGLLVRQKGNTDGALPRRGETQIDARKQVVADLLAQLLTSRLQSALRGRQRGAVLEPFLHEAVELVRLVRLPPLRHRSYGLLDLLRHTVGDRKLR